MLISTNYFQICCFMWWRGISQPVMIILIWLSWFNFVTASILRIFINNCWKNLFLWLTALLMWLRKNLYFYREWSSTASLGSTKLTFLLFSREMKNPSPLNTVSPFRISLDSWQVQNSLNRRKEYWKSQRKDPCTKHTHW